MPLPSDSSDTRTSTEIMLGLYDVDAARWLASEAEDLRDLANAFRMLGQRRREHLALQSGLFPLRRL